MKRKIAVLLVIVMLLACVSVGCGKKDEKVVNVYNWGEYIDESIFADFKKETGITVNYSTYASNEIMYSTLKNGGSNYDVIIPSDYMVSRLIEEGMLEKIDFSKIPNFSLIGDEYKNLEYDPTGEYSVPYMNGTLGLIYNPTMTGEEITDWGALFDPKYTGMITMIDNSRDAIGVALMYLGYSLNTTDEGQLREAYDLLKQQKEIIQGYAMDQIFVNLESGETAIGVYYAGDYITMLENNPDLKFVVPEDGTNFFLDAMCIPKGAANKENAEAFINFMCSTDVCLANMEFIGYASANTEAAAIYAEDMDPELVDVQFATPELIAKCEVYTNLPQETLELYNTLWIDLKA